MNKIATIRTAQPLAPQASLVGDVLAKAETAGLLGEKSARVGVRISPALLDRARQQTGIESNTDLVEFALASVAVSGNYGATFREIKGRVDPGLKLGY